MPAIGERMTPLEVAIWLAALIVAVALGVLVFTGAIGSWAVLVPGAMGMAMALWRYRRSETERKRQTPEDQGE